LQAPSPRLAVAINLLRVTVFVMIHTKITPLCGGFSCGRKRDSNRAAVNGAPVEPQSRDRAFSAEEASPVSGTSANDSRMVIRTKTG